MSDNDWDQAAVLRSPASLGSMTASDGPCSSIALVGNADAVAAFTDLEDQLHVRIVPEQSITLIGLVDCEDSHGILPHVPCFHLKGR